MGRIDAAIATLLLNSLWQVTLVAGLTWAVTMPVRSSAAKHRLWALSLIVSLMLPLASVVPRRRANPLPAPSVTVGETARSSASGLATPAWSMTGRTAHQEVATVSVPGWFCLVLTTAYVLFLVWRLALARRAWRATCAIRTTATRMRFSEEYARAAERCRVAFGLPSVVIASSPCVRVPAAIGSRSPIIALPDGLLADASTDELIAVLGHEMAHIERRDFGMNLWYEFLYLPVSFHPAAAFIKRRVAISREQACDDMVIGRLMPPLAYARSLLTIAGRISTSKDVSYGVAAGHAGSLEARVSRLLVARSGGRRQSAGWAWVAAGVLSTVCSCVGFATALRISPTRAGLTPESAATARGTEARLAATPVAVPRTADNGHSHDLVPNRPRAGIHVLRNEHAAVVHAAMNRDRPSDGSGPDAVIGQTNNSVADADQPPVMTSAPFVAVPDTELVGALEASRQIGFSSHSLLAAAQTVVSQDGVAAGHRPFMPGHRRFMPLPNFHELSTRCRNSAPACHGITPLGFIDAGANPCTHDHVGSSRSRPSSPWRSARARECSSLKPAPSPSHSWCRPAVRCGWPSTSASG
jgi:beta-lactamase regulating signal transducer with metallopeptidase domain